MAFRQLSVPTIPRIVPLYPDSASTGAVAPPCLRFTWQTGRIGNAPVGEDLIRPAAREEAEDVLKVLLLSLSMDSAWNDSMALAESRLKSEVTRLFNSEDPFCLVIPKGNRLIAASLLDPSAEAPSHLVSGPSVLVEYRNRGIGSRLLHASLEALEGRGISVASGVTRAKTVAARHVYPKFGGTGEMVQFLRPPEAKA